MATYKVPQDVEADDKLIGPFSFRQFIYLIIVVMAGALAWGLGTLFIGLAVIPLPIILLFGALALPLRKDQPMEIYLAALVSFYLKPRQRLWDPEGIESMIEITAPKVVEVSRVKDLSQDEAEQRLNYLASLVDSRGWAIRGVSTIQNTAMNTDVYLEAQSADDVLDTSTSVAQNFDQMMARSTERVREEARARMMQPQQAAQPVVQPVPLATPVAQVTQPPIQPLPQPSPQAVAVPQASPSIAPTPSSLSTEAVLLPVPEFNPYPEFNQAVIQPLGHEHQAIVDAPSAVAQPPLAAPPAAQQPQATPQPPQDDSLLSTSDSELSAGIISLANDSDLSIETIAHQADRLAKKAQAKKEAKNSGEVVISLR